MANKLFTQLVETMCKTKRKTPCISRVKNCALLSHSTPSSVKLHFPTNFSHLLHQLFHKPTTSVTQLFYPLFHSPYNNNY